MVQSVMLPAPLRPPPLNVAELPLRVVLVIINVPPLSLSMPPPPPFVGIRGGPKDWFLLVLLSVFGAVAELLMSPGRSAEGIPATLLLTTLLVIVKMALAPLLKIPPPSPRKIPEDQ